jgi:hypothetical protein
MGLMLLLGTLLRNRDSRVLLLSIRLARLCIMRSYVVEWDEVSAGLIGATISVPWVADVH